MSRIKTAPSNAKEKDVENHFFRGNITAHPHILSTIRHIYTDKVEKYEYKNVAREIIDKCSYGDLYGLYQTRQDGVPECNITAQMCQEIGHALRCKLKELKIDTLHQYRPDNSYTDGIVGVHYPNIGCLPMAVVEVSIDKTKNKHARLCTYINNLE